MNKKSLLFFIVLLVALFTTLAFAFKPKDPNADKLKRLDVISTRLAEITKRQTVLSGEINEREMEYFDLNEESIVLNDEASSIFMKLMDQKELIDQEEPKSQCDALIEQELKNIELGIQTKEGFIGLVAGAGCEYDGPFPETEWYPGKLTEDGDHQVMPELTGSESHERFKELMSAYGLDPKDIWEVEEHYGLTEGLVGCITIAETSGGKAGAGKNNIGNVGNTDSNPRGQSYSNLGASLDAIGRVLNNQYLGSHYTLACLSNAGDCIEPLDNNKRYATSTYHWQANMKACLSDIYGYEIDPASFNIRNR